MSSEGVNVNDNAVNLPVIEIVGVPNFPGNLV